MIPIEELRIGNYVKCTISNDHGMYKILALANWEKLSADDISRIKPAVVIDRPYGYQQIVSVEQIKPIKLTLEVLTLMCGFVAAEKSDRWGGYVSPIRVIKGSMRVIHGLHKEIIFVMNTMSSIDVETLHKLQNLYFLVQGEELEITKGLV
ncbi:MAG TPA: hypothetical protein VK890_06320 [Bacteroidia bacterium]|nr:hypothetical protein [Bacteroidia bacterium]